MTIDQQTENKAIDMLLESGVSFSVASRGYTRLWRKQHKFVIKPPTLATLYLISKEINKVEFDHRLLMSDTAFDPFHIVLSNASVMSRVVAVSVEPLACEKRIEGLSKYFYHNLHPSKLLEIVVIIVKLSGISDFTSSIALIKTMRATAPKSSTAIE